MIVGGSRCAMADKDCAGRLEWHHAVTKNRLKREFKYGATLWAFRRGTVWKPVDRYSTVETSSEFRRTLDDILGDTRNRIWICQHHFESGQLPEIPEPVWDFCLEFGLDVALVAEAWNCDNGVTTKRGGTALTARPRHHETRS